MTSVGPSPHLSWAELACKDGTPYPAIWRGTRAITLAGEFEELRRLCGGRPLEVLSGFRTIEWNQRVGGSRWSQHPLGRAVDVLKPGNFTIEQFTAIARAVAFRDASRLRGIGVYPWGVHLDVRPSARMVVWHGTRPEADRFV